ncbi:MAG: NAD(P)H-dependent oxidoreductase [Nitrosopumilus sp.]|nr:NAD(P)H-dependent oxidoreductase [Nitrosopumilus sp.]MDH3490222.1 NAD(P)H-dependent oxidoreductase [Nitrosopumilus sp.]MDH3516960.1 NAD(P)H-dependent oxidoreductase [Nitrosopumilus sp.]MDH3565335.1 NAD(P)H-dependent oxidoreductase [Nitrosopumilus sp.]MDH5417005.1 NAD(P)H-dependent oxidoreductase [Nitrosopumilus sp.]
MNIAIILGSVRQDRNGVKVSHWITKKIAKRGHRTMLVDPMQLDLPILDKMYKEMKEPESKYKKLHDMIDSADGYVPITTEYNHTVSGAMKNTLDCCLDEYFFKPSAIVSYSVGPFGGINAAQHLRHIFAGLGSPSIPSSLQISKVSEAFGDDGKLLAQEYDKRVERFLDEFDWYLEAFRSQRNKGVPY